MIQDTKTMDIPLDAGYRRKKLAIRWATILLVVIAGGAVISYLFGAISPSVERERLRFSVVDYGSVESGITATGTVIPEFEQVIPSPLDARVMQILKRPGDSLLPDELIVRLDIGEARLQLTQLIDRIALKSNARLQMKATLEGQLIKLDNAITAKQAEVELNRVKNEQSQASWKKNFISKNDMLLAEMTFRQSQNDLASLEREKKNIETTGRLQQEGLMLEIAMLHKEKEELEHRLEPATTRANRKGILTWVVQTEGAMIHKGDILARLADLSSYRVQATISDVYASRVAVGMPVQIRINEKVLEGRVVAIQPAVENGIVNLSVSLAKQDEPLLRPNLRVDVDVITDRKAHTLRMKRAPSLEGGGRYECFVLRNNRAVRTTVTLGMAGTEYCEILSGLSEGDKVIISDMKAYSHMQDVRIE